MVFVRSSPSSQVRRRTFLVVGFGKVCQITLVVSCGNALSFPYALSISISHRERLGCDVYGTYGFRARSAGLIPPTPS